MRNSTGNGTGNGLNKRKSIVAVLLALSFGLCTTAPMVRAQEPEQVAKTRQAVARTGLSSRGSLVYTGKDEGAQIYAADFLLLKDRMGMVSDTVFEPGSYMHTYSLEAACMSDTYACGNQPEQEEAHAHELFFEPVDETVHRSRCRMEGTELCPGYEPVVEEHYAYFYEPCEDGCHHEKVCMDCGYRKEEDCCFGPSGERDGGEDGSSGDSNGRHCCWCGNMEKPGVETGAENADVENGDKNADTGAGDKNTDTETGDENMDAEPDTEEMTEPETEEESQDGQTESENQNAEMGEEIPETAGENGEPGQADQAMTTAGSGD